MAHADIGYPEALVRLKQANDSVRAAIGEEGDGRLRGSIDPR